MMKPMTVKIGGHYYEVEFDGKITRDYGSLGNSCGNDLKLAIDASIPLQNQQSTLLHEILEQINYRYELDLEHNQITILESVLYQVLQDNPEVVKFITDTDQVVITNGIR